MYTQPAACAALARPLVAPESRQTSSLYASARSRGQRGQFWSNLTGRSRCLFKLAHVEAACRLDAHSDAGLRTVAIAQILGSEGRSTDFDREFNPLKDHNQQRWQGIARARLQGKALPPVSLVQVGDIYFVRDGHHRISVARALGQEDIEAKVTSWQVTGQLPWEAAAHTGHPGGLAGAGEKIRDIQARLVAHTRLNAHTLMGAIRMTLRSPSAP
jgi:hypothetical protein